jgi:hypothetical protein
MWCSLVSNIYDQTEGEALTTLEIEGCRPRACERLLAISSRYVPTWVFNGFADCRESCVASLCASWMGVANNYAVWVVWRARLPPAPPPPGPAYFRLIDIDRVFAIVKKRPRSIMIRKKEMSVWHQRGKVLNSLRISSWLVVGARVVYTPKNFAPSRRFNRH